MNKRDLIKALFKNPTIKALYESGHFDASDINRAILTEAEGKTDTEGSGDGTTDGKEYSEEEKKQYMSLAKLVLKANALINKPEFVNNQVEFLKNLDDTNFLKELVFVYLNVSKKTDQTNTAGQLIDKYEKDENIKPLQQSIEKLKASLGKIQGKSTTPLGEPSTASVNEYVDGLANEFDEKATKTALQKLTQWSYESGNSDAKNMSILKAFVAYAAQNKELVSESEQEAQLNIFLDASVKKFIADLKTNGAEEELVNLASKILKDAASNKGFQEIFQDLKDKLNLPSPSSEEESIEKKRQQLLQRASSALAILNVKDSELLKNDTFMIFMGSVLEKEGVIQEVEEQLESYVEKYLPQLENEETRKEFYITQEEVGELKTFLETNKADVDKIIAAAVKASKDSKDPNLEDVSPPELAELQENWNDVLMTFFGKNPKKSSFMRRLLLRSQAQMLYDVMDVLEQISDPEQMSAYTDMNQDDEREKKAEKAQLQKEDLSDDDLAKAEEEEREKEFRAQQLQDQEPELKATQQVSMQKAAQDYSPEPKQKEEPEVQSDKIELPAKTRRIIKQDLQSMVDLLRQLKLAIKDYSMYATRKSADPRFDGSKLKANMDELLTQVQDDIYDLHSNLKPADLAPETDDGSLEEALNGIMLEEDDPERQAKIQLVRQTYDNAKREYIYSLATSMEQGNWGKSQASAKKILDILKEEKFISLFPTGMKTAGGKVMTVGKAYESMTAVIQEFVETVRDIVLISKEKYIAKTSLTQAKNKLKKISIEIAELFRVPSKFSPEEIKQAKEEEATDPANKAITPEPETNLEKKEGDNTTAPAAPTGKEPETATIDDEKGEPVEPEEKYQTTYPDPEGIKKQLGADLNEDDPVILDYMQSLLEAISEIIRESSSTTVAENVFSGVKKFAKGMKRSLTTDASEATEQIVDSMQFKNKEAAKELIEQSLSSNTSKILRKYNFKDLAEKTDKFFNQFKDLFNYVNEPTAEFRADAASIASELTRSIDADIEAIGGPLSPKEGGEDKRNPIKKEELKSILAKYKKEYLKGKTPSAPRTNVALMHALAGLYGETLANFLIDKVAPRLTSDGVKDSRAKKKKAVRLRDEIKKILENPVEGSELYKLIKSSVTSKERTQYAKDVYSMFETIVEVIKNRDEIDKEYKRIKNGQKPNRKVGSFARKKYEELERIYPGGLKRFSGSTESGTAYNFMAKFGETVFKNPDIIPDDEQNLADNIVGYYKEYLKNEDNDLSPSEIMDLRLITIEGPVETVEEALKPIIEKMLKEHYNY